MNLGKIVIDASKLVSEGKEVCEICQLSLDSNEVNNIRDACTEY